MAKRKEKSLLKKIAAPFDNSRFGRFLNRITYFGKPPRIGIVLFCVISTLIFIFFYEFELTAIFGNVFNEKWVSVLEWPTFFLSGIVLCNLYGIIYKAVMVLMGKDRYEF